MAVYVDKMRAPFGRMIMCHMLADSITELQAFADSIHLSRAWYQSGSTPHYDISLSKRREALKRGAIEIEREKVVEIIRKYRKERIDSGY